MEIFLQYGNEASRFEEATPPRNGFFGFVSEIIGIEKYVLKLLNQ